MSLAATSSRSAWVKPAIDLPLGKFCRSSPLLFSLLPRCQGRDRSQKAVELSLDGWSYDYIARGVGLSNRGNAWRTVQKALGDRVVAGVDELRELECDRLDAL